MWWMRMLPLAVDRTRVTLGFCFPRATVELPHFEQVFERYKVRWATAVGEDNGISANQQAGLRSPHRRPGRFTPLGEAEHCVCGASGAAAPAFLADRHGCGVFARRRVRHAQLQQLAARPRAAGPALGPGHAHVPPWHGRRVEQRRPAAHAARATARGERWWWAQRRPAEAVAKGCPFCCSQARNRSLGRQRASAGRGHAGGATKQWPRACKANTARLRRPCVSLLFFKTC